MKFSTIVTTAALIFGYVSAAPSPLSLAEIVQGGHTQISEDLAKRNVIVITATYNGVAFSWLSTIAGDAAPVTQAAADDTTTTITTYVTATTTRN